MSTPALSGGAYMARHLMPTPPTGRRQAQRIGRRCGRDYAIAWIVFVRPHVGMINQKRKDIERNTYADDVANDLVHARWRRTFARSFRRTVAQVLELATLHKAGTDG